MIYHIAENYLKITFLKFSLDPCTKYILKTVFLV